ncbi:radical SAM protein [Desulfosarcina ovata subsp. sediminis]|uniref:Radical SAM protein n=1 Tax=Desulfosarcina ovata subsp. sediminis TaxID=885957 RepID=A0A5K7ZXG5_9BACT|nr:radical SAM protein [Desulfosarcina ovata]BBO84943.1 radical SAM protein [Desulfosarcina ovata subsp. sediminis]
MKNKSILLIHPPVAKPGEPPAGLAKLAAALRARSIDCRTWDASLDGILGLLAKPAADATDTWTRRALAHRRENTDALRSISLYGNRDRYKRAVMDLNRVLHAAGKSAGVTLSLANYTHPDLSPVRSGDLIRAAETFRGNPFFPIFSSRLEELFKEREPHVVGLSINFMSQALCAFAMIGCIRSMLPEATIVCGGGLVTSWLNIPGLGNPFHGLVDELVSGPGEARLISLCTGSRPGAPSTTGYDFSDMGMDRYLSPVPVRPYAASRGCWWKKCAFCPETAENAPYRCEDAATTIDDLLRLNARFPAGLIHFLDNALSPRLLEEMTGRPPGLPWYGFARVTRHFADVDFVQRLKQSGCVMLKLGIESGDQQVLNALGKGIDSEMAASVLHTLHQAGIATYVYLLFGTPAEDESRARRTLDFTLAHSGAIDFLNLAVFNLPAHSREAAQLETLDFYEGDLSLYREFVHPGGWNRDRVRRFLTREFKKPAPIRRILNNDPPFFTSNHAPFFHSTPI